MMAGWGAGGTEMLRSLSDSAIPPSRDYDNLQPFARKRQLHQIQHLDITDDYEMLREWKRPRVWTHTDERAVTRCDPQPVPAFFIIKEAGWSAGTNSLRSSEHNQIHNDATHRYGCNNMPAQIDTPRHDLRVRNEAAPSPKAEDNFYHDMAARDVEANIAGYRRQRRLSQHERILKSLISPKAALNDEFEIDDEALQSILSAANEIFFGGNLKGRVTWTWGDLSPGLIGTTAWREAPNGNGFQTLIWLSKQILKDKKYNRRLLISTFIHELIHSYLFVRYGYHPDDCGGHTSGFKRIAKLINNWVGEENILQLHKMEAELSDFEIKTTGASSRGHASSGCQVQWLCDGTIGYIALRPTLRLRG